MLLSGITESVSEDILQEPLISVLCDIDVFVDHHYIEVCHRFGKPDRQSSHETIMYVNRKHCTKFDSIDCSKYQFMQNTKIFANQNLIAMNVSIVVNIFLMDKLHRLFPDFGFGDANGKDDLFFDVSQVLNY